MEAINFVKKLQACIKEYNKQSYETGDDIDAAHFYDKGLKKWIKDHIEEINILSTMGLNKSFVIFIKHYLLAKKEEE